MQMVNITIRVLSKPDTTQLRWIFRTLGKDYDERVLPSIVNEVSKAVVVRAVRACLLACLLLMQSSLVDRFGGRSVRDTPPALCLVPTSINPIHPRASYCPRSPPSPPTINSRTGQVQCRGAADEARARLLADPPPAGEARERVPHRPGRCVWRVGVSRSWVDAAVAVDIC